MSDPEGMGRSRAVIRRYVSHRHAIVTAIGPNECATIGKGSPHRLAIGYRTAAVRTSAVECISLRCLGIQIRFRWPASSRRFSVIEECAASPWRLVVVPALDTRAVVSSELLASAPRKADAAKYNSQIQNNDHECKKAPKALFSDPTLAGDFTCSGKIADFLKPTASHMPYSSKRLTRLNHRLTNCRLCMPSRRSV